MTSEQDVQHIAPVAESGESTRTVLITLGANGLIAVAKTIATGISGSASMMAEAAHSRADTGNQVFLLIADRRGRRRADARHPLGFGREAYVWSLLAAVGLFVVGASVSIWHGVTEILHGESAKRDSTTAAVIGIVIAFAGIGLHQLTGNAVWDAIDSILVGVLLGIIAVVLIDRNRRFLTGELASDELRDAVVARIKALPGDDAESRVARTLRRLEQELEYDPHIADAVLTIADPEDHDAQ